MWAAVGSFRATCNLQFYCAVHKRELNAQCCCYRVSCGEDDGRTQDSKTWSADRSTEARRDSTPSSLIRVPNGS